MPSAQMKPKMPKAGPSAGEPTWSRVVSPVVPAPLTYAYTLGRLRPRFVDPGAWHELASLVPGEPLPTPGTDAFDRLLVRLFGETPDGQLPATFYLARSLVWPVVDSLGVPQALVVPADDEEISELVANLPTTAPAPCSGPAQSLVRGYLVGHVSGLDAALDGLPMVAMVSVLPFTFSITGPTAGMSDAQGYDRLFQQYQPLLANNGLGNEQRAVNFVLTSSKPFYDLASRLAERGRDGTAGSSLVGIVAQAVDAPPSRPQMEVVFTFQAEATGAEQRWFQRVATGGPFPYFTTDAVRPYFGQAPSTIQPQSSFGGPTQARARAWSSEGEEAIDGPTWSADETITVASADPSEVAQADAVVEAVELVAVASSADDAQPPSTDPAASDG